MKNVYDWTAVRSGAAITITGTDAAGAEIKITGVKEIHAAIGWPMVSDGGGELYNLLPKNHAQICAAMAATADPGELMGFLAGDDSVDRCIACEGVFADGDLVHNEALGGLIHAACCGPERESYFKNDGEPLDPGDPIPTPFAYSRDPAAAIEAA